MRYIAPKDAAELDATETREWLDSLDYVLQRGIDPVEPVENAGKMLQRYAGAGISHRNFGPAGLGRDGHDNFSAIGREAQGVLNQITERSANEQGIRFECILALASHHDLSLLRCRLIIGRNFFQAGACVETADLNLAIGRFRPRQKKQVVD